MYYRNDNLDFNPNFNEKIDDIRNKHHNKCYKKDHTTDDNKHKSTHTTDDHSKDKHTHTTDYTTEKHDKMPYAMQPMGLCPYMMSNCPMMHEPQMLQPAAMHDNMNCGCNNNSERFDNWDDDLNDDFCDDMQRQGDQTSQPYHHPQHYPYQHHPYYPYPYYYQYPYYHYYPYYHQRPWWMR